MNRSVADASLCGAWILPDESSVRSEELLAAVENGDLQLVLPALWHYEMLNLIRSAVRRQRLTATAAKSAVQLLGQVPVTHFDVPDAIAQQAILRLAQEWDLSAYDAAYLELALRLRIPLHTADEKLARAADQCGIPAG